MSGETDAPGWPGIPPRWTSSAKTGVGTALGASSLVWFTISHGILDEVYYPRIDEASTRDLGLIVTDGESFFSEEKRHAISEVHLLADGVPAYRLVNTCSEGNYVIQKEIIAHPQRDAVLQRVRFTALQGDASRYRLYALLAPHLGNHGADNTAELFEYKGVPMLGASRDGRALALACSRPWTARSAGFVGYSDGWQDLSRNKRLTAFYDRAANGNVALTGEIPLEGSDSPFVIALAFGRTMAEAGHFALASLLDDFDTSLEHYTSEWNDWQQTLVTHTQSSTGLDLEKISATVIRTHEAKRFAGGLIAGLSIPWGFSKGDDDLGGYHLIWPRDLVETAGGLLAVGAKEDVRRILRNLHTTQEADGSWPQNMWLDGTPYWSGIQMDETAFPILLVDLARREGALDADQVDRLWPMVRKAASFIVRNGPVTQQDRWEEDPGYSPFTLAVEVAGLLVAAELADAQDEPAVAEYLRETADIWNSNIERWTYAAGTDLALQQGVDGYYVRIVPPEKAEGSSPAEGFVPIKNRPPGSNTELAVHVVSPDALALVRFGLRSANDPRILGTVKVIDDLLKVETPKGPAWHRYDDDGYGEHEDGSPFDGTGIGRVWPLLTGERAHYELAAGNTTTAESLKQTLEDFSNDGGLLPEQIWDSPDIPERELWFGRPSGSAMPLAWAHAEYLKLVHSLADGHVFDAPPQTIARYVEQSTPPPALVPWRFNHKLRTMAAGNALRIEVLAPAIVHWSADGWQHSTDTPTADIGLGIHMVDLPTASLQEGTTISFTFRWSAVDRWEGTDFHVPVVGHEAAAES